RVSVHVRLRVIFPNDLTTRSSDMTDPRMREDEFLPLVYHKIVCGCELHISKPGYLGTI
ncbi:hypothetical protein PISMIDRAFT_687759, partial [Pisolithus microcarpus 441]